MRSKCPAISCYRLILLCICSTRSILQLLQRSNKPLHHHRNRSNLFTSLNLSTHTQHHFFHVRYFVCVCVEGLGEYTSTHAELNTQIRTYLETSTVPANGSNVPTGPATTGGQVAVSTTPQQPLHHLPKKAIKTPTETHRTLSPGCTPGKKGIQMIQAARWQCRQARFGPTAYSANCLRVYYALGVFTSKAPKWHAQCRREKPSLPRQELTLHFSFSCRNLCIPSTSPVLMHSCNSIPTTYDSATAQLDRLLSHRLHTILYAFVSVYVPAESRDSPQFASWADVWCVIGGRGLPFGSLAIAT